MAGLTFDTGALIGLERKHQRIRKVFDTAVHDRITVTVPAVVIAEWWRGADAQRDVILRMINIELMDAVLGKLAGAALAEVRGATTFDAIIMASAARRGDVVYTSDIDDLAKLQRFFPNVRVFHA